MLNDQSACSAVQVMLRKLKLVVQWFGRSMIGNASTMIVSQSCDKEAYLKAAYNRRSMALQDLNPLMFWL